MALMQFVVVQEVQADVPGVAHGPMPLSGMVPPSGMRTQLAITQFSTAVR